MPDVTAAEIAQGLDGISVVIKDWRRLERNPDLAVGIVANPTGFAEELKRGIDSYPDFGTPGSLLTCDGCPDAPAALLAVIGRTNADRTPAPGHVFRPLCRGCADKTADITRGGGRMITFFRIGQVEGTNG